MAADPTDKPEQARPEVAALAEPPADGEPGQPEPAKQDKPSKPRRVLKPLTTGDIIVIGICAGGTLAVVLIWRDYLQKCRRAAEESAHRMEALAVEELRKRQAAEHAATVPATVPTSPAVDDVSPTSASAPAAPKMLPLRPVVTEHQPAEVGKVGNGTEPAAEPELAPIEVPEA